MTQRDGLKVLLVYDCVYPESVGGVEHRNHQMARALGDRGHRITVAGFTERPRSTGPRSEVKSLGHPGVLYAESGRRSFREALRLAAAMLRIDLGPYDVVETANIPYLHLLPLAIRCRLRGKPLLVTWYEYWGAYWRRYLGPVVWLPAAFIEWLSARVGTMRLTVSRLTEERLRRYGGRRQTAILPIGISVDEIRAATEGAVSGPPLVHAGRLQREKRIDVLLHAVRLLDAPAGRPLLTVVGDGPEKESLERLARHLGVDHQVVFAGRVPEDRDVWRILAGAKIAVQPSYREGYGLFPLEAMALGLPVVYCESTESAVPELVRYGREGLCVEADPEDLAAAIQRLLDDQEEYARLSRQASARAETYDWPRVVAALENLLTDLVPAS